MDAGRGEGGSEGTWLSDPTAAQKSDTHLQAGPEDLQGSGYRNIHIQSLLKFEAYQTF